MELPRCNNQRSRQHVRYDGSNGCTRVNIMISSTMRRLAHEALQLPPCPPAIRQILHRLPNTIEPSIPPLLYKCKARKQSTWCGFQSSMKEAQHIERLQDRARGLYDDLSAALRQCEYERVRAF